MRILVLNCGSSSVKYQLFDMATETVMSCGLVDKIGLDGAELIHKRPGFDNVINQTDIPDHGAAIVLVIDALLSKDHGVIKDMKEIDAVGHRIVHGGIHFLSSCVIDDACLAEMEQVIEFAPLHNPAAVLGMRACLDHIPGIPMVAVFDTSFHQTMPPAAYMYGIPYEYYEKYQVRRYGCHGTSHCFVSRRCEELMGTKDCKIITCHLGSGSSLAAIDKGKVVDTSMGFTPLAGVLMGTRCGDIDPAAITYIMGKEGMDTEAINHLMNKQSGLLGISGVSSDMRYVKDAASEGNERAQLALDVFERTVIRYIGAYTAVLNGVDAIVFTAGIGENNIDARASICKKIDYLGFEFDDQANDCRGKEVEISKPGSKVRIFVIPTNEELMIARETKDLVNK